MKMQSSSPSSSSLHRPWQADWKNPEWKISSPSSSTATTKTTTKATAAPSQSPEQQPGQPAAPAKEEAQAPSSSSEWVVGTASAQVALNELPQELLNVIIVHQREERAVSKEDDGSNDHKETTKGGDDSLDDDKAKEKKKKEKTAGSSSSSSNNLDEEEEESYFTLSVTLISRYPDSNLGTEILLELMQESTMEILYTKKLLWPETILMGGGRHQTKKEDDGADRDDEGDDSDGENNNDDDDTISSKTKKFWQDIVHVVSTPWKHISKHMHDTSTPSFGKKPKKGLVSATFCRRPHYNDPSDVRRLSTLQGFDALDTMTWMGLGMDMAITESSPQSPTSASATSIKSLSSEHQQKAIFFQEQPLEPKERIEDGKGMDEKEFGSSDDNNDADRRENPTVLDNEESSVALDLFDDGSEGPTASEAKQRTPSLYLACVTNKGLLTIYSPWDLLVENKKEDVTNNTSAILLNPIDEEMIDNAMTNLFFGSDLFNTLQSTWKPLCEPLHSITVSIMVSSTRRNSSKESETSSSASCDSPDRVDDREPIAEYDDENFNQDVGSDFDDDHHTSSGIATKPKERANIGDSDDEDDDFEVGSMKTNNGIWDLDLWNPLLESWTLPYRTTFSNQVTHVLTAGSSYLILLGKGCKHPQQRRRRHKVRRNSRSSAVNMTVIDTSEVDDDNAEDEQKEEKEAEGDTTTNPFDTPVKEPASEAKANVEDDAPWWAETPIEKKKKSSSPSDIGSKRGSARILPKGKRNSTAADKNDLKRPMNAKNKPTSKTQTGGFVSFVSTTHWSETRTLYLPFIPKSATYIPDWNSMELLLVIGDHDAWTIRMDVSFVPVQIGDVLMRTPSDVGNVTNIEQDGSDLHTTVDQPQQQNLSSPGIWVRRFQALPISLASQKVGGANNRPASRLLCGRSDTVLPPALMELYTDEKDHDSYLQDETQANEENGSSSVGVGGLILLKTFKSMSYDGQIELAHAPGHVAKILTFSSSEIKKSKASTTVSFNNTASFVGQGWSVLATQKCVYWICWEGATASRGVTFVEAFPELAPNGWRTGDGCFLTNVLPIDFSNSTSMKMLTNPASNGYDESGRFRKRSNSIHLPFSGPYKNSTSAELEGVKSSNSPPKATNGNPNTTTASDTTAIVNAKQSSDNDGDIVADALESISEFSFVRGKEENLQWLNPKDHSRMKNQQSASSPTFQSRDSPSKRRFSHREKSERLLRQCSSWVQLESSRDNRLVLERQVPVVSLRYGTPETPHRMLTLRQLTVRNGPASPFQQVLSWLCNRHDYFTAASIGLDLLNDPESLYHLWKHAEKIDEEDEQNKLDGLLDGITPIKASLQLEQAATINDGGQPSPSPSTASPILVQLADMTVGCLIKGGLSMSKTLNRFLQNDKNYDAARACLMLVATTANAVSGDPSSTKDAMGDGIAIDDSLKTENLLWPVECLLQIGASRDYLSTCLVLLNVTIPDELRRRPRQGGGTSGRAKLSTPSMELTKSLITLILSCDHPDAIDLLLGLVDDQSRVRFWQSLDHETRLVLSLIGVDEKHSLVKEHEVRSWIREELHGVLKDSTAESAIPTDWLRELAAACLQNAGCELSDFILEPNRGGSDDADRLKTHNLEIEETRGAIISGNKGEGLYFDFDLLIPCLLLLQNRRAVWAGNGGFVSTQSLLDAVCYFAGREEIKNQEEEESLFDASTAMRQCALAGNVRAAANLIGGTNGFILRCCDILMVEMQVSMEDAESFLLRDSITLDIVTKSEPFHSPTFNLTDSHRELLWLMDEYVLSIRTFGEFDTTHLRGRVDPVFCARSILRSWLVLTYPVREKGSAWLVNWLRERLSIQGADPSSSAPSPHRLACATLVRALVWPSNTRLSADHAIASGQMLGQLLGLENKFLLELSCSCCGLVESVPDDVAEDVVRLAEMSGATASVLDGITTGLYSDRF